MFSRVTMLCFNPAIGCKFQRKTKIFHSLVYLSIQYYVVIYCTCDVCICLLYCECSGPLYKLMTTNLGGERRFAACVARRLQSLGEWNLFTCHTWQNIVTSHLADDVTSTWHTWQTCDIFTCHTWQMMWCIHNFTCHNWQMMWHSHVTRRIMWYIHMSHLTDDVTYLHVIYYLNVGCISMKVLSYSCKMVMFCYV